MNFQTLIAARERAHTSMVRAQIEGNEAAIEASMRTYAAARDAVDMARDGGSTVDPALAGLIGRARAEGGAAAVAAAVIDGRPTAGAVAELQGEMGAGGAGIPLDLLSPNAAVTPGPAQTGAEQPMPIGPVFSSGAMAFLGITQRRVASGDLVVPTLQTRPTVGRQAANSSTAINETTGTWKVASLEPSRIQAGFEFRRTEAAQLQGMEQALSSALNMALNEELDNYVVGQIVSGVTVANSGAHLSFETWRSTAYGLVEGRHAASISDIRLLVGSATYGDMGGVYATNGDESALRTLQEDGVQVRVSPHIAATASKRQSVVARLGMADDATMALWPAVTLIRDEITGKAKGEIGLTAVLLATFALTRAEGFRHIGARIEA